MEKVVLVINSGSSSVKFAVFDKNKQLLDALYRGEIDGIGHHARLMVRCVQDKTTLTDKSIAGQTHGVFNSILHFLMQMKIL